MAIDTKAALYTLGEDLALLKLISKIFQEDSPVLLAKFLEKTAQRDAQQAQLAIHSLKGLVASFFDREAVELFGEIEIACQTQQWKIVLSSRDAIGETVNRVLFELTHQGLIPDKSSD